MSKVNAYRCDYCGEIKTEESIVGISAFEDIFDKLKGYEIVKNPERAVIHGCLDCYSHCLSEANNINRKKYEQLYIEKRNEGGFMFRQQCVLNSLRKQYTPPKLTVFEKDLLKVNP